MAQNYLFDVQATIHDVVRYQEARAMRALDKVVGEVILAQTAEALTIKLTEEFSLNVPILDRSAIVQLPNEEIELDGSQEPMRGMLDRSQPFKGIAMRIAVPFIGEPELFKYRGSTFGSAIPGEIDGENVVPGGRMEPPTSRNSPG